MNDKRKSLKVDNKLLIYQQKQSSMLFNDQNLKRVIVSIISNQKNKYDDNQYSKRVNDLQFNNPKLKFIDKFKESTNEYDLLEEMKWCIMTSYLSLF